ncbi:MAG: hypothetical protein WCO71_05260 [Pseudomonadota bacterium]|jgi:hypothetical protein
MNIYAPKLETIGGDLSANGNKSFGVEFPFPKLETIKGNMIIPYTGMKSFPKTIRSVGGMVVISDQEPASLVLDIKKAKRDGIIKGEIWCILTP